jgi:hypothetical protein
MKEHCKVCGRRCDWQRHVMPEPICGQCIKWVKRLLRMTTFRLYRYALGFDRTLPLIESVEHHK